MIDTCVTPAICTHKTNAKKFCCDADFGIKCRTHYGIYTRKQIDSIPNGNCRTSFDVDDNDGDDNVNKNNVNTNDRIGK